MAQFDIHDLGAHGLVVDCQSDLMSFLRSRLVVPLRPKGDFPIQSARFNPVFEVGNHAYVLATQFPRAIEVERLGNPIASLSDHDLTIKGAIDMLISGY